MARSFSISCRCLDWTTFYMPREALAKAGVDIFRDLHMISTGGYSSPLNFDNVMDQIRSGYVDAGFISSRNIVPSDMRVVSLLNNDHPVPSSTELSPEFGFAAFPSVDPDLRTAVFQALLRLNATHPAVRAAGYAGWRPALSYEGVRNTLQSAQILRFYPARWVIYHEE